MKKTTLAGLALSLTATLSVFGCGGGGGGTPPPPPPTKIVVTIMTQGTPSSSPIAGIDVTLTLPAGVTVNATPDAQNNAVLVTDAGVVAASGTAAGANANVLATYTPANGATPGSVSIKLANPDGFTTGDFVTVNCDIAAGSSPKAADFGTSGFAPYDQNGDSITGLNEGFTAAFQ